MLLSQHTDFNMILEKIKEMFGEKKNLSIYIIIVIDIGPNQGQGFILLTTDTTNV